MDGLTVSMEEGIVDYALCIQTLVTMGLALESVPGKDPFPGSCCYPPRRRSIPPWLVLMLFMRLDVTQLDVVAYLITHVSPEPRPTIQSQPQAPAFPSSHFQTTSPKHLRRPTTTVLTLARPPSCRRVSAPQHVRLRAGVGERVRGNLCPERPGPPVQRPGHHQPAAHFPPDPDSVGPQLKHLAALRRDRARDERCAPFRDGVLADFEDCEHCSAARARQQSRLGAFLWGFWFFFGALMRVRGDVLDSES
eukprot:1733588-Rhodomonas_salina.2